MSRETVIHRTVQTIRTRLGLRSSWWDEKEERVRFTAGGVTATTGDFPDSTVKTAYEGRQLKRLIQSHASDPKTSLEIGCGYGRMTGWIIDESDQHYAIDQEEELVAEMGRYYPAVDTRTASADSLPFPDGSIDVVMTWTVLQHVPPSEVDTVADEIMRVLSDGGLAVMAEETHPSRSGEICWPRSIDQWRGLFSELELVTTEERDRGPHKTGECGTVMVFRKTPGDV